MPSIALPVSLRGQLLSGVRVTFSPLSLFSASEPGFWYDPSDLTTMFQDTAGATPVTTPGQTVARINDKSGRGNNATQATAASRPTYQVDGNGFAHLSFDGVDDFLVTSTITPGTDKVQVFAGVRKLSDATRGSVIESGLGTGPDTGYFHIEAPRTGGVGHYAFRSFGATLGTFSDAFAATFNAPITNVVTGIGDIPADTSNIRVNGAAGTPGVADQGTGNYLANAIYIGRRAGTSLPFSGNMYNIVLRFGPNLDSGTIASVETFINGKTGAY